jgi:hypothetical protein
LASSSWNTPMFIASYSSCVSSRIFCRSGVRTCSTSRRSRLRSMACASKSLGRAAVVLGVASRGSVLQLTSACQRPSRARRVAEAAAHAGVERESF